MKLLIVTQAVDLNHPVLGFFHGWLLEFSKHCEEVLVICLQEGRHDLPQNVRVLSLGKDVKRSRFTYLWRFYRYIYAYRHQYDAVFVHMNPEYVVLGGFFWRQWGKPVALWYVHKSVTLWLRVAALLADAICTVSPQSIRLQSRKVHALGHGVDTSLFAHSSRTPSGTLRVLSVGRIAQSKGLIEVLRALDELHRRHVDFSWTIVGAPSTKAEEAYAEQLKEEIERRLFADRVRFVGAVAHRQLPDVYAHSDVLVNISATGGYDKVVLEAIAAGVPALSSGEPFWALLVRHGLFINSTNPNAIADAIVRGVKVPVEHVRQEVLKQHSLQALVPRILSRLT